MLTLGVIYPYIRGPRGLGYSVYFQGAKHKNRAFENDTGHRRQLREDKSTNSQVLVLIQAVFL